MLGCLEWIFQKCLLKLHALIQLECYLPWLHIKGWKAYHLDLKSMFLNGYLQEEIYVEQLEGFLVKREEEKVYKLKKALYNVKQALMA